MESRRYIHKNGSLRTLIKSNLNNDLMEYSPWNYCPPIITEGFNKDLDYEPDLINKAVYMDPGDQSPWLYLRWLITNHGKKAFIREMYVSKALESVVLISSEPVFKIFMEQYVVRVIHVDGVSSTSIVCDDIDKDYKKKKKNGIHRNHRSTEELRKEECASQREDTKMGECENILSHLHLNDNVKQSLDESNVSYGNYDKKEVIYSLLSYSPALPGDISVVWLISLSDINISASFTVETRCVTDESFLWQCHLSSSSQESLIRVETDIQRMLYDNVSYFISISTLSKDLSVIRDLLENEPDNKWSLLALVSILRLLSPIESRQEILDILHRRLPAVDPQNIQFYFDAASKFILECHLITLHHSHIRYVSLANYNLTSISHLPWMALMTHIDLSNNQLTILPDIFRHYLLCLIKLNLSGNHIISLLPLKGLRSLHHVDVSHNLIATFPDLEPVLHCIKLTHLNIKGNLVSQLSNLTDLVISHPTSKLHIGSLSIVYDKNL